MEPIFLDMAQMENYQHDYYSTYGDQMQYSYDTPQYSAAQPYAQPGYDYYQYQNVADQQVYSAPPGHEAVIVLATDQQSGSFSNSTQLDADADTSVMSFKTEAEMLEYFSTLGGIDNIQILPTIGEMENTEKYIDQTPGQSVPAVVVEPPTTIDSKDLVPVLPDQPEQPVQRKPSTKSTTLTAPKRPRTRHVYENSSFVCEPCGRTFGRRSSLRQHNNVHHSGPREHRCEECGKRFHTVDDLHRHVKRHVTLHKPYKCAECPRQFNYQQDLVRHVAVQHGVAKYACQHCGKRSARRDHLLAHEATHTRRLDRTERRNRFQELAQQQVES